MSAAAPEQMTIYSTPWCGYCHRLMKQLDREGVAYATVDIEQDPASADYVMSVNGGNQTVPTVVFPDGSALTNPSLAQVKEQLGRLSRAPGAGDLALRGRNACGPSLRTSTVAGAACWPSPPRLDRPAPVPRRCEHCRCASAAARPPRHRRGAVARRRAWSAWRSCSSAA